MEEEWIQIARFEELAVANIYSDLLRQENILSRTTGVNLVGIAGGVPLNEANISLHMAKSQAERAIKVISEAINSTSDKEFPCKNCGEACPENFARCWNCNAVLDF